MMRTLLDRIGRARRNGIRASLRCRIERLGLGVLQLWFGFDRWHSQAPFSCRGYKRLVVDLVNGLNPSLAVEIGCGLGEILGRVEANERIGIDADARVIRAARFLRRGRGTWLHGDAADLDRLVPGGRTIDCLIMVNWIHNLSPDQLAGIILPVLGRTRYLIVDAIDGAGPVSYRYKHDFEFLARAARRRGVLHLREEPRSLIVFEVPGG
ncbi:MAG TPA: class I SAM-dependent methyltransferase [Steroidobacteraceae bacterium]|jgi:SAM-dependent methyltransferase|nr:class I SAM-dependent methyltransferase [Steroidobacteraceae bacterium]